MAYQPPQPPYANGICTFVDNGPICMAVQEKLASIRDSFTPDQFNSAVNTFWIVVQYNTNVAGTNIDETNKFPLINGDTAEHCLALYDEANAPTDNTSSTSSGM